MPQSHISKKEFPEKDLYPGKHIQPRLLRLIQEDHPDFDQHSYISNDELVDYRKKDLQSRITATSKELSDLENEVISSISSNQTLTNQLSDEDDEKPTFGQKVADGIANFGGSWTFIISFFVFLGCWMAVNAIMLGVFHHQPFDVYPFILLNLILSCLAAIQAPLIMMSQNRKEARDRKRAENDYKINLKAELEIQSLHEKIDHINEIQNKHLEEVQKRQTELLEQISKKLEG